MIESHISNRALFPSGEQKKFLQKIKARLILPDKKIAHLLGINIRTLTDWKREKFSIPLTAIHKLTTAASVQMPSTIKVVHPFWYTSRAGRLGGLAVYNKYGSIGGDPKKRQKNWRLWWEKEGKFKKHPVIGLRKAIRKPEPSIELAEFVGIMLGDGGVSHNQVFITLNSQTDKEYSAYVLNILRKLFNVQASIYKRKDAQAINIVISRRELVNYCQSIGLPIGHKVRQHIDIPAWIQDKQEFQLACMRGLVDTDGSVIKHTYHIKEKKYCYKKLSFSSRSPHLLQSASKILQGIGFSPKMAYSRSEIILNNQKEVKAYFDIVGSSNPKHLQRYRD